MEEIKIKPFALELIQEEFRHLDRMSSKQSDFIHKLWSELSVKDKLLVEDILDYYVEKLQKRKVKNKKLGRVESEEELNQKVFTKTLAKFFPTLYWYVSDTKKYCLILTFEDLIGNHLTINITIKYFNLIYFNWVFILLINKGYHKASSQTLNKES